MNLEQSLTSLSTDGFTLLSSVYSPNEADAILLTLANSLTSSISGVLGRDGTTYAARNVLALCPPARDVWRQSPLPELLMTVCGTHCGIVRALFFDKPPGRSWPCPGTKI